MAGANASKCIVLRCSVQSRCCSCSLWVLLSLSSSYSVDSSGSLLDYERLKDRYRSQSLTEQRRSSSFLALPRGECSDGFMSPVMCWAQVFLIESMNVEHAL